MKRTGIILLLTLFTLSIYAQEQKPIITIDKKEDYAGYKEYGGFILDLNSEMMQMQGIPKLKLFDVDPYPNFKQILNLNTSNVTYGLQDLNYTRQNRFGYSRYGNSITDGPVNTATFRINDVMKVTTYGDYDAQGYRRVNPSAMPWERNNFRGGFELKTSSGFSFGIQVERKGSPYRW